MDLKRLGIIGTGLIGASVGLAAKRAGVEHVAGCDFNETAAETAKARGAIDERCVQPEELLANGIDLLVVAHDIGSAAAEILVADVPQRVRGLVIADGVYADQWAMEWVDSVQQWDPRKAARLAPVLGRRLRSPTLPAESVDAMLSAYEGESGGLRLIAAARALHPNETATRLPALRAAGVPALVLWGTEDRYLPIDSVARPLADLLRAELRLIPGGHFLPAEAPQRVAEEIIEFEKSLRSRGR